MELLQKNKYCKFCKTEHPETKEFWDIWRNTFKCKEKRRQSLRTPEHRIKAAERIKEKYQNDEAFRNRWKANAKKRGKAGANKKEYAKIKNNPELYEKRLAYFRSPEFKQKRNAKLKKLKEIDPSRFLAKNLRDRVYCALRGNYKAGSAVKDLGCSIDELKKYLESQFQPGMGWDNRSEWHIDHIQPLASFDLTNPEEFKKACHYTNLQPLWAQDNLKKSSKLA